MGDESLEEASVSVDKAEGALAAQDRVDLGGVPVSPLGIGTWSWGDKLFWDYNESMDKELQEASGR